MISDNYFIDNTYFI